ncbi:MAG: cytochrome c biogenesis protein ResB [Dehalococcoidia bacterium]|nr:cytochrome c biogenesis protein ResB [Dehalococcoidia bacterium]
MEEREKEQRRDGASLSQLGDWLWRFLSSVRLVFVLMIIIIALSLVGTLVMQVPGEIAADPSRYDAWLTQVAQQKYGLWTPLLSVFKFFGVFQSPWFLAAGALLMLSILVCSLDRWKRLRRLITGGTVKQMDEYYAVGSNRAELSEVKLTTDETLAKSSAVLKRRGYRVRTETAQDKVYLAADKNRYYRLGTYLSHLSLILFILGYIIGSYWGFRNTTFIVPEGDVRDVGYGTDLSLRLISFVDEYYPEGNPRDYRSEVILYKAGQEVDRGTIRVNHPMGYEGVRFFQSFFGTSATVEVKNPDTGEVFFKDGVPLEQIDTGMGRLNMGSFYLPAVAMDVYVFTSATRTPNPMIKPGELGVQLVHQNRVISMDKIEKGTPKKLIGLDFTLLGEGQYSGFQVSRDPGNVLIWIASGFFMVGIALVMYFPHRQMWALIQPRAGGKGTRVLIRSTTARGFGAVTELRGVVKAIETELGTKS